MGCKNKAGKDRMLVEKKFVWAVEFWLAKLRRTYERNTVYKSCNVIPPPTIFDPLGSGAKDYFLYVWRSNVKTTYFISQDSINSFYLNVKDLNNGLQRIF